MGKLRRLLSKFLCFKSTSTPTAASSEPAPPRSSIQQSRPSSTITQLNAPIENLPAEMRCEILHALEYESLRALVHASPTFHQQFLMDRRPLLCGCLQKRLGAATVDACAAYKSDTDPTLLNGRKRIKESVAQFLKSYQDKRSSETYSIADEALTEDEAVAMVAFHFTIIEPLSKRFTSWALGHLADETGASPHHEPLSTVESTRVIRAMYRFQLFCNLFHDRRDKWFHFESEDIANLFFCLFEIWEVEEVACIFDFCKHEYNRILRDIQWDLHPDHARFDDQGDRPPTPSGAFYLDNEYDRDYYSQGTVICGLEFLYTALFKMRDHEHLVTTMQERITLGLHFESILWARERREFSERDLKPFMGDVVPDPDGSYPPLAFTVMWNSYMYSDLLVPAMRPWGYVMWDATRLKTEGGKALLLRQTRKWGDWEPQDMDLLLS